MPPSFSKVLRQFKTAVANEKGQLDVDNLTSTIALLQTILTDLNTELRIKTHVPLFNCLANELVVEIFKHVLSANPRDSSYLVTSRERSRVDTAPLLWLTHVCRKWREVALGCPELWARVDGECSAQLRAFLLRSQHAPISLFLRSDAKDYQKTVAAVGPRIRRLDLTVMSPVHDIRSLLRFQFRDVLECITISYTARVSHPQRSTLFKVGLLGGGVLPIKALALDGLTDWVPTNQFPSLTHLYLALHGFDQDASTQAVLLLLSKTPKVEFVTITCLDGEVSSASLLPLPHLRLLELVAPGLDTAADFLSLLQLPSDALVRVDNFHTETADAAIVHAPGLTGFVTRLEVASEEEHVRVIGETSAGGLWLEGSFGSYDEDGDWCTWVRRLPEMFPLAQITRLQILIKDDHDLLAALLSDMPSLTELAMYLSASATRSMCKALSRAYLCPMLQSAIFDIEVDAHTDLKPSEFSHMIDIRAAFGHPLREVLVHLSEDALPTGSGITHRLAESFRAPAHSKGFRILLPQSQFEPFADRRTWAVDGSAKYWDLEDFVKPVSMKSWNTW
ncbi:hypothetical protein OH76DRAFT_1413445 [Lentinus brumalis]|uniref:Uncharacterized protein n=1 Tax=Lentinus brumalis TaxID=2498619 RepID=A0A371CH33_9APHY|nr:hypothetical protein OH76DRAFT_1413445 [Polyporus brumalis]